MIDPGFAAQLAEDIGPSGLRMVLDVFRKDLARLLATLEAAAEGEDATAFRRTAHGLAGAAGAVGAAELERACRAAMAQTDAAPAHIRHALADIHAAAAAALRDLNECVARLDPQG